MPEQRLQATGHENVLAEHQSTLEITTEDFLTEAGDCIIGVSADCAPASFDTALLEAARDPEATITLTLRAAGHRQTVTGRGDPAFSFENELSMVVRTSEYVDDRTVMVEADTAAVDLDREFVAALAAGADLTALLRVD